MGWVLEPSTAEATDVRQLTLSGPQADRPFAHPEERSDISGAQRGCVLEARLEFAVICEEASENVASALVGDRRCHKAFPLLPQIPRLPACG